MADRSSFPSPPSSSILLPNVITRDGRAPCWLGIVVGATVGLEDGFVVPGEVVGDNDGNRVLALRVGNTVESNSLGVLEGNDVVGRIVG